jgi:hypothetical protein
VSTFPEFELLPDANPLLETDPWFVGTPAVVKLQVEVAVVVVVVEWVVVFGASSTTFLTVGSSTGTFCSTSLFRLFSFDKASASVVARQKKKSVGNVM